MKRIIIAACAALFVIPALAEETVPPKTYTITEAEAADYARRLQAEMQAIAQQYKVNEATLNSLIEQGKKRDAPPADKAAAPK